MQKSITEKTLTVSRFDKYLQNLGFSIDEINEKQGDVFSYKIGSGKSISFVFVTDNNAIFLAHQKYWNNNNVNVFIAVSTDKTYIINSKQVPNRENPIAKQIAIKSFDYGTNTKDYENVKPKELTKEYIDSTYFFDFIIKLTANKKKQEVDKHLLLNLIALRNDLLKIGNDDNTVHLLILRSLFIKYLEDKKIYPQNYWTDILSDKSPEKVLSAFNEIKRINGNIFDEELPLEKIKIEYISLLHLFFISDYRSGQQSLFPYLFDKIPVQLISHVYEAFLKSKDKKGKGIYYTPSFVVNFMLSHSLSNKLQTNNNITILDPAVGSGAFLVESLKMIFQNNPNLTYEQKKEVLQNQLFGIDIDRKALQIAAFSLYLTLIETENPDFIKEQIENSHPILPSLIGENLICANALTDDVFPNKIFDCILSNPPWGSVEPNEDIENVKERKAINTKGKLGTIPEYINVADYERSQAFLVRVRKWSNENTVFALIVKNSIFLNDTSEDFRKELLDKYQINQFYELSNYNKILFKKQKIGKINGKTIEIGASEPCAILVFELPKNNNHNIKYISPKLNGFSENFLLIHYTQKDINEVNQSQFIENDLLWRVLVNGDFEIYSLINNIKDKFNEDDISIESGRGFEPKKVEKLLGETNYKNWIDIDCFNQYEIYNLKSYNWNQEFRNKRDIIFESKNIIFPRRPLLKDNYKLRAVIADKWIVFKDNIVFLKIIENNKFVDNYQPYLGLINSSLYSFVLYHISVQWDKGDEKRASLRISDIRKIPLPKSSNTILKSIGNAVKTFDKKNVDNLVFDLYNLKEYQKEIIREFYQIRVERAKQKTVKKQDIEKYTAKFSEIFENMLDEGSKMTATYKISQNVGVVVCFKIVDKAEAQTLEEDKNLEILHFVKRKQINNANRNKILNEDKVKIYDNEFMYIIKSNQFKDWTIRQAIKDAREELGLLLSKLPENHE